MRNVAMEMCWIKLLFKIYFISVILSIVFIYFESMYVNIHFSGLILDILVHQVINENERCCLGN